MKDTSTRLNEANEIFGAIIRKFNRIKPILERFPHQCSIRELRLLHRALGGLDVTCDKGMAAMPSPNLTSAFLEERRRAMIEHGATEEQAAFQTGAYRSGFDAQYEGVVDIKGICRFYGPCARAWVYVRMMNVRRYQIARLEVDYAKRRLLYRWVAAGVIAIAMGVVLVLMGILSDQWGSVWMLVTVSPTLSLSHWLAIRQKANLVTRIGLYKDEARLKTKAKFWDSRSETMKKDDFSDLINEE